jgi:3-oxoacid CoA-transferase subunit A
MSAATSDVHDAVARLADGMRVMVGGFGLVGSPLRILDAIAGSPLANLTVISNNVGEPGVGLGRLLRQRQISTAVGSYFTSNPDVLAASREGWLEVQLVPQGTLAEAIRCGGAGIPAFYTPTAAGTQLAEGKEVRTFEDGRPCVLERAIRADVALIKAAWADEHGNLAYRGTARNFNPVMATAADLVIAEVDGVRELEPEQVVTPHLYVDLVVRP